MTQLVADASKPEPANGSLSAAPCCAAWPTVAAAVACLAGSWIASGSAGLLAHPLRHVLVWTALALAVLPNLAGRLLPGLAATVAGAVVAGMLAASDIEAVAVLAPAVLLGGLAVERSDADRRVLRAAATSVAVLALFRLLMTASGTFWLGADVLAGWLGEVGGAIAGRPAWLGPGFAALDPLVAMVALLAGWLAWSPARRLGRGLLAGGAVLVVHAAYLALVARAPDLLPAPDGQAADGGPLPALARITLPWNLPAVAAAAHLLLAAAMLRWTPWSTPDEPARVPSAKVGDAGETPAARGWARWLTPGVRLAGVLLAVALAASATLTTGPSSLRGKKVVAWEKGFLNWLRPEHGDYGRLSIGMYGMLPEYVRSLGGLWHKSADLSAADLADADVLILLFPDTPWQPGQKERVLSFVRRGGSLLLLGEHTTRDANGTNRFNELLKPTDMHVRFDSGTFAVGGWLHSYHAMAHPATIGLDDERNGFGVVIGASMALGDAARPLLIGRWGWADRGDDAGAAQMGDHAYEPGERLGDLVLAAEQPVGDGRIVAFGDTSSMTNGISVGAHRFTSRLLGYLGSQPTSPQATGRQIATIILAVLLAGAMCWRGSAVGIAGAALVLGVALSYCTASASRQAEVLPDGRLASPNNLAYIDSGHLGHHSEETWRPRGLAGLELNLMRSGFLTLSLDELTPRRLERAGLLVSAAPMRPYTEEEIETVEQFVEDGGIFICTVGYDERGPSRGLLKRFGFIVGGDGPGEPVGPREPQAMGHHKAPYLDTGEYRAHVRYHAPWPVWCSAPPDEQRVLAYGRGNKPVIVQRTIGRGKVVVVGDTAFAQNRNLERRGGQPFEGMRENADFWRWLLAELRGMPEWIPPDPATATDEDRKEDRP